jgi:hypothetical protein
MKTLTAVLAVVCAVSVARADVDKAELLADAAAKSNAGDHGAAISIYERVYFEDLDPAMLPILATEYRRAGLPLDAMSYFCHYLSTAPKGPQAAYATAQVIQLRNELGQKGSVCDAPKPMRVDFATPRQKSNKMSKREIAGVATAAFGLVSLGVGVYYGYEARSISNQITNHPAGEVWPDNIGELEARGERYESRQNKFLLVGGAALVTAGVLYFTGRADRRSETFVAPSVTSSGAGISFARGF